MQNISKEQHNTQLAAIILSGGMFIFAFKNQPPIKTPNSKTITEMPICILTLVEKIVFNFFISPRPNSNVMKRLMALDKEPETKENIATTPPTTL